MPTLIHSIQRWNHGPTVKHRDTSYSTASYPPIRLATPRDDLHHFVTVAEGLCQRWVWVEIR
jgi:hypothetical protein